MSEPDIFRLPTPVSELPDGSTWVNPPEQDFYEQLADAAYADDEDGDWPRVEPADRPATEVAFRRLLGGQ